MKQESLYQCFKTFMSHSHDVENDFDPAATVDGDGDERQHPVLIHSVQ